jgi:prophage antirepressor-like protein
MKFNLHYVVQNIVESTSIKEYIKKVLLKEEFGGTYIISKENLIPLLEKAKSQKAKDYLVKINDGSVVDGLFDETKYTQTIEKLNKNGAVPMLADFVDFGSNQIHFKGHKIHFISVDEKTYYFKATDITKSFGYINTHKILNDSLDDDEKLSLHDILKKYPQIVKVPGCIQIGYTLKNKADSQNSLNSTYINESGLYTLIMRSNKPEAKKFKKWVTSEVLPSIRMNGEYKIDKFDTLKYGCRYCFYLFNINNEIYKFGITKDLTKRFKDHKDAKLLHYPESQVKKIITFDDWSDLSKIETKIKQYIKQVGIHKDMDGSLETFEGHDNVKLLVKMVEDWKSECNLRRVKDIQYDETQQSIKLLSLQNDNIKSNITLEELKIKKKDIGYKLEIEKEKIKSKIEIDKNNSIKEIEMMKVKNDHEIEMIKLKIELAKIPKSQPKTSTQIIKPNNSTKPKKIDRTKDKKCTDCDTLVQRRNKRCRDCESKYRFYSSVKMSYSQLIKDMDKLKSYRAIGKKYCTSDVTIRKNFRMFEKYEPVTKI